MLRSGAVRYKVVVDVGDDPASGRRRQRKASFGTLKEARNWLAETRLSAARGEYTDSTRLTLSEYLHSWLAGRLNIRPSTRRCYQDSLRPFHERVGAVPLVALTKQHVESVRNEMLAGDLRTVGRLGQPLAPRTVRMRLQILQTALDGAMRDELITRNVAALVERPSGAGAPGAAWTAEEAEVFLDHVSDDRLYAAWLLSLHGLRRGEVAGLRWADIDFDERTLSITSARVLVGREVVVSPPKTARGARVLPMPADVVDALFAFRDRQQVEALRQGDAYRASGYVLSDESGAAIHPEVYAARFRRLATEAGVPVIRLHDARHTSVSLKRSLGWPDHLVAAWHGHDEAVMRATYTHSYLADLRRHTDALPRRTPGPEGGRSPRL